MTENSPYIADGQEFWKLMKSHLYVMQSASGRIKIGKSRNPETRRKAFERKR